MVFHGHCWTDVGMVSARDVGMMSYGLCGTQYVYFLDLD